MPDLPAANERLTAPPGRRQHLQDQLTALRTEPGTTGTHPELTCTRLSDLLASPSTAPGLELLRAGLHAAEHRYRQLGLTGLLPPDRVWIGTTSINPGAFGGFHYPAQGYRHWQMAAIITRYGSLTPGQPACTPLAALDLIRAYAHDCLHYGTYRQYRWQPGPPPAITRTRYGINFRRPDGRTYSAPDPPTATSTRNLGIIMEAATDTEAQATAAHAAGLACITKPPASDDRYAYRDSTGRLDAADCDRIEHATAATAPGTDTAAGYLARMARYHRRVTARYQAFLTELGSGKPGELHHLILTAMITGQLTPLTQWLAQHHGPGAFRRIFKTPAYTSLQHRAAPAPAHSAYSPHTARTTAA